MTDKQTPPDDWVLLRAAEMTGVTVLDINMFRCQFSGMSKPFRALCDMIERYEQPPVDRKLLCAREAHKDCQNRWDESDFDACVRAIELHEQGFGK